MQARARGKKESGGKREWAYKHAKYDEIVAQIKRRMKKDAHACTHTNKTRPSLPFDRQHCILVRVATPICKRPYQPCGGKSRATYRDEKKRKEIEREGKRDRKRERETEKEGERDEEMGVGARRKGTKEGTERIAGYNGHDITIGITRAEK